MPEPASLDPVLAAAWGLSDRNRPGPKPRLQLAEIVDAAIRIADDEGLEAVSMARVAGSLGYTTMSLYRYVGSKQELLTHMQDAAGGLPDRERAAGADWRAGLEIWTLDNLDSLLRHPWQLDIPFRSAPLMPRAIAWLEWALELLHPLPLSPLERLSAVIMLSGYARNEAGMRRSLQLDQPPSEPAEGEIGEDQAYIEALRMLTSDDTHPQVTAMLDEGFFSPGPAQEVVDGDEFMLRFGLHRILDGLESLVAERQDGSVPA